MGGLRCARWIQRVTPCVEKENAPGMVPARVEWPLGAFALVQDALQLLFGGARRRGAFALPSPASAQSASPVPPAAPHPARAARGSEREKARDRCPSATGTASLPGCRYPIARSFAPCHIARAAQSPANQKQSYRDFFPPGSSARPRSRSSRGGWRASA